MIFIDLRRVLCCPLIESSFRYVACQCLLLGSKGGTAVSPIICWRYLVNGPARVCIADLVFPLMTVYFRSIFAFDSSFLITLIVAVGSDGGSKSPS
jgi:hypothetical protein